MNALKIQRSGVGKVLYITHSSDVNLNWVPTKHGTKIANCIGIGDSLAACMPLDIMVEYSGSAICKHLHVPECDQRHQFS